jgi:hypothetical protein
MEEERENALAFPVVPRHLGIDSPPPLPAPQSTEVSEDRWRVLFRAAPGWGGRSGSRQRRRAWESEANPRAPEKALRTKRE